jgi:hypothetical protein
MRDIDILEARLPQALARAGTLPVLKHAPRGWARQYVGIVRGGRRYLYGNFFPEDVSHEPGTAWLRTALQVCDGGPAFFGVEFDVAAGHFTHVAFNGHP